MKNSETGWLTYLWHLHLDRLYDVIEDEIREVLEILEARLNYEEKNDFYVCKNCGIIYTFADAAEWNFECPNCEEMLGHFDNGFIATALRRRVEKIKESLGSA